MNVLKRIFLTAIFPFVLASAQVLTSGSLGMGLNYSAQARGTDALSWNPANLGMMRDYASDFSFLSLSTITLNNSLSFDDLNYYFQDGKVLSESDKTNFLNLLSEDGIRFRTDTDLNLISFVYGRYGFSLSSVTRGTINMPREFFELMMLPTEIGKAYDMTALDADAFSAIKTSFAYSHWFNIKGYNVSVGGQINYYFGLGVIDTEEAGARITQDSTGILPAGSFYSVRGKSSGPGGSGFGFDFGFATTMMDGKLDLSLGFKNLIGSISWGGNAEEFVQIGRLDSVEVTDFIDGNFTKEDTTYEVDSFSTPLPASITLGAAYRLLPELTVTADWHQGLDEHFGNTTTPRIGAGVEYFPVAWLPLRGGLTFGGKYGSLIAFGSGLRLDTFDLDLSGAFSRGFATGSSGYVFGLSFRVKMLP